jgi:hypothetical protein
VVTLPWLYGSLCLSWIGTGLLVLRIKKLRKRTPRTISWRIVLVATPIAILLSVIPIFLSMHVSRPLPYLTRQEIFFSVISPQDPLGTKPFSQYCYRRDALRVTGYSTGQLAPDTAILTRLVYVWVFDETTINNDRYFPAGLKCQILPPLTYPV